MIPHRHLARFPHPSLQALCDCAAVEPRVADLAASFPLIFQALAAEYGPLERRLDAVDAVVRGRPLVEVAPLLGLPMCFKRVPPEACSRPLDWVEFSADFNLQISNLMPDDPARLGPWLELVFYAAAICDEPFALWIARQHALFAHDPVDKAKLWPLALYYWHCREQTSALNWLAFTPWQSRMALASAIVQAKYWFNRVKLLACCGETPIADSWLEGGVADGYDFVPLVGFWQIMEERLDLDNCLDCYGQKLALDLARVFGIRRAGRKVGALEIGPRLVNPCELRIVQIKGPVNGEVAIDVRVAACAWFERQRTRRHPGGGQPRTDAALATGVARAFEPFGRSCPAWGLEASRRATTPAAIDSALALLASRVGVAGWPFGRTGLV